MFKKIIIAGFPGVGKSTAAKKFPKFFIDVESSDFHWIYTDTGEKVCHPEWPQNYVSYIRTLANDCDENEKYKDIVYICCSTHKEVLSRLLELGQAFICVLPGSKDETIERYKARGNTPEFIKSLSENWDAYEKDILNIGMPVINLHGRYLADYLESPTCYNSLLNVLYQFARIDLTIDLMNEEKDHSAPDTLNAESMDTVYEELRTHETDPDWSYPLLSEFIEDLQKILDKYGDGYVSQDTGDYTDEICRIEINNKPNCSVSSSRTFVII